MGDAVADQCYLHGQYDQCDVVINVERQILDDDMLHAGNIQAHAATAVATMMRV